MIFTTIKECEHLNYISSFTETTKENLKENILNFLFHNQMIEGGSEDWGKTLIDVLNENSSSPMGIVTLCLKTNSPKIVDAFENLTLFNPENLDCPDCGSEIEEKVFWEHGEKWTDKSCVNYHCDYYENNQPVFDESYEDGE